MAHGRIVPVLLAVLLLLLPLLAFGAEKPQWEVGVGGGFLMMPDYRGSDKTRPYLLPFPYAVYRGGIFRLEDKRLTARLFKTDRVTLDASGYGAVPVKSDDNEARRGMEDLDPTFEFGPALRVKLLESHEDWYRLSLAFPVRAVFSTDFRSVRYEGWVFSPRLNVEKANVIPQTGIYLGISAGPMFGDRGYHQYFYDVAPAYATAWRPVYRAGAGYSGSTLTVGLGKNYRSFHFQAFVSADFLQGAVFEDSPLVKTKTSWMSGFSITWVFLKSKKTVADDTPY
ncbi:MAG TPA: MipA/OmpV family protein [Smithellaceae bacterium]|nr:MipA/OmpV family protein [Smithellaceae bacterium]HRV44781.1 MipA/OmpV family protein [Smithellaceae bacterium]